MSVDVEVVVGDETGPLEDGPIDWITLDMNYRQRIDDNITLTLFVQDRPPQPVALVAKVGRLGRG